MNGRRLLALLTLTGAICAALYVLAKVQYAVEGRLGVHGGPVVSASERAAYASTEQISAAQWANVAAGVLILAATLLPVLGIARRWSRWAVALPVFLIGVGLVGSGAFMLVNGARSGAGGYPFAAFSILWGVVDVAVAWVVLSTRRSGTAPARRAASS